MARPSRKTDEPLPVIPEALSNAIGYLLNFNGRIIRERTEQVLEPLNLTLRELGVMRILESEGPLSQHVLGRRHNIDRTTTVQVIDQLEERQLVIRSQNVEDRRSNLLFLTPRGRKTLTRALKLVNKEQNAFLSALSDDERTALYALLNKLLSYHLTMRQHAVTQGRIDVEAKFEPSTREAVEIEEDDDDDDDASC